MWFEQLTGFRETGADDVRSKLRVEGAELISLANDRRLTWGALEIPSLDELRRAAPRSEATNRRLRVREIVADTTDLHADPANAGALFQVASQFNLLEMVTPGVTPDDGIDGYSADRTQGPACAIACGAGTTYRNYFVPVDGRVGQSATRQIDCLRDLGALLGNDDDRLWTMRNGYALATADGLAEISHRLAAADDAELERLRGALRIGLQIGTQVTLDGCEHLVTQAFCSALPVAYSSHDAESWAGFASLVLESAYEAILCAAVVNAEKTGNRRVFLTLLGGGAFGNRLEWIVAAIERAFGLYAGVDLDVAVVSYGRSREEVRRLVAG